VGSRSPTTDRYARGILIVDRNRDAESGVSRAMNDRHPFSRHAIAATVLALVLAACSSAASLPSTGGGTGSGVPHDDPTSAPPDPDGGGNLIDPGKPALVLPKRGQLDPHPVAIEHLSARADGHRVVITATWWSGVEPCYVLDSTAFKVDGKTITVSVREGSSARDVACIEIAMHKVTVIDLGKLDPGTYAIVADKGDAEALEVTVNA
jgi:hypothetical protein